MERSFTLRLSRDNGNGPLVIFRGTFAECLNTLIEAYGRLVHFERDTDSNRECYAAAAVSHGNCRVFTIEES